MSAVRDGRRFTPRRQAGHAAVEFAFVFPLLFLLIYGSIVYSYIFVLQQSINFVAQEAAEAAVAVDPDIGDLDAVRTSVIRARAVQLLSWLPEDQRERSIGSDGERVSVVACAAGEVNCPPDRSAVIVTITFDIAEPDYLFPVLNLLLVTGQVPPMPERLVARATALVEAPT